MEETIMPSHDFEVFVPENKEDEYLRTHRIEKRLLPNGITIIGMPRSVEDLTEAEVHFSFPAGSYNDPSGKEGIHHLFEHLIMNPIGDAPESVEVHKNASTSAKEIDVYLAGIANPAVKEYAVWPMLEHVTKTIKSPLAGIDDLDSEIKRETRVIVGEMTETRDYDYFVHEAINKFIYDPTNPILTDGLGTEASLANITANDVVSLANKVFIPDGLFVSLFTQGDPAICTQIVDKISSLLGDFPREGVKSSPVDRKLYEKLNPNFRQGSQYQKALENNGRIKIVMPWILPFKRHSVEEAAASRFVDVVSERLFTYTRKRGTSYSAGAFKLDFDTFSLALLDLNMPARPGIVQDLQTTFYPDLREEVFGKIDDVELETLNKREQIMQRAILMSAESRLNFTIDGIRNGGRIIDADAIKTIYSQITPSHLEEWKDRFMSSEPAFIIVGDIKD